MNHSFYQQILTGDPAQIFDDQDNVVWIDWGDEEDAIVDAIRDHLGIAELNATTEDADNDHGYLVRVCLGEKSIVVDPSNEFDSRHATINAIDDLLPEHEIRFVTTTNGSDTIAVAVERVSDWKALHVEFGQSLSRTFCPIRVLPDLMNTPGKEIDDACDAYAEQTS